MTYYSILKTPLEDILVTADATQLSGLYFIDSAHSPAKRADWVLDPRHPVLAKAGEQLHEYFNRERTSFSLPLHLSGTGFQRRVWREIASIPFGETLTYSELAQRAGAPRAIRAAGTATGHNPIGIVIPCHRVVGKNGSLGGYAGGLERKRRLLALEHARVLVS
jgi:methylated-DNA-[protein]-cysteine S-methyltransferase